MSLLIGTSDAGEVVLPIEAATTVMAIVGTRGAGKTETGTVLCEELYAAGVPWVAIDPLGVMHGLRSSIDGLSAGLAVNILGGAHGDVSLAPTAGAAIADLVVDWPGHYVLDLSDFDSDAETDRFAEQFAHRLIRAKARAPFAMTLVVDEADQFIPQQPFPGQQRMLGAFNALAKRARVRGIGMALMTQRPASLNKNTLSMAECLFAMKLMSPQDQGAVEDYVKRHLEASARQDFMKALPSFLVGQAWLWAPHWTSLQRIQVRRRRTFDSSATPKPGETVVVPKVLAPVDIEALREAMAAAGDVAAAEDPKALRAEVAELRRQIASTGRLAACEHEPVIAELRQDLADSQAYVKSLLADNRDLTAMVAARRPKLIQVVDAVARLVHRLDDLDEVRAAIDIEVIDLQQNRQLEVPNDDARPAGGLPGDGGNAGAGGGARGAGGVLPAQEAAPPAAAAAPGQRDRKAGQRVPPAERVRQLGRGGESNRPAAAAGGRRTEDMTDEELTALVDQKIATAVAMIPGVRVEVLPAELIRHEYQREAVGRLMAKVGELSQDAQEAMRFMLGQDEPMLASFASTRVGQGLGWIAAGATGRPPERVGKALRELVTLGVVREVRGGGSGGQGYKPDLVVFVRGQLAAHDPPEEDVQEVVQAVLGRIAGRAS